MAVARSRANVNIKGGGILKVRELFPTATDTWTDLGFIGGTDIDDARNMVDVVDERGLQVEWLDGGMKVVIKSTLQQSDIDLINFLRAAGSKLYEMYYMVTLRNTKIQEFDMPLARFNPGAQLKFAAATPRAIPIEIHGLAVKALMTRTPATFNITADEALVVTENAAAQGAPSDTASTVYSTLY